MRKQSVFCGIACVLVQFYGCGGRAYEPNLAPDSRIQFVAEPIPSVSDVQSAEETFIVRVEYADVPKFTELNGTDFDWCNSYWDRDTSRIVPWGTHTCFEKAIDTLCYPPKREEVSGNKRFVLKRYDHRVSRREVLSWADQNRLQYVNLKELLAFAAANPNFQKRFPIHAFGTFVFISAGEWRQYFPVLTGDAHNRALSASDDETYRPGVGFLFLRE